jgi:hypothetical protein
MTPITSFGVFESSSVPVLMTMRRPLATKALNSRSSTMTICPSCEPTPAAAKIGCE